MIISDKRQKYYGEIKSRFYLRRSTASGPRKIYFVVYIYAIKTVTTSFFLL